MQENNTAAADDGYEVFGIVRLTNKKVKSASYFNGVYIILFEESIISLDECIDAVLSMYPTLRDVAVDYLVDDELVIFFNRNDANFCAQLELLNEAYPGVNVFSIDSPAVPCGVTLDVLDMDKAKPFDCDMLSEGVGASICPSTETMNYEHYAINHSMITDITSLIFFGGAVIKFKQ